MRDIPRFDAAVNSTMRLRDTLVVDLLVIAFAYARAAILLMTASHEQHPAWHGDGRSVFSWAGWWHAIVSLPLLLVLLPVVLLAIPTDAIFSALANLLL